MLQSTSPDEVEQQLESITPDEREHMEDEEDIIENKNKCAWFRFSNIKEAQGFALVRNQFMLVLQVV